MKTSYILQLDQWNNYPRIHDHHVMTPKKKKGGGKRLWHGDMADFK